MINIIIMMNSLLLLATFDNNYFCSSQETPEVDTPLGKIRGVWKTSTDGRKYAAFEGIPYAKPPVGDLRFEEPQPIEPWTDVLNATEPRTCLQTSEFGGGGVQGEEDCLHLNVFVPTEELVSQKKFDVQVMIHGGGFMIGSGHQMADSSFLMDRDLILVSINYRVGIFGFLSTEDDVIPGNNGMKDQVFALKWVRDNIASFGGNPDSVTIIGLSAGGASVHLHYFSSMSKGLFARGLSQSGTALDPWVIRENPLESAKKLAVLVDCPDFPTVDLKQCLKKKPALLLNEKVKDFYGYDRMPFSPFAPVIEKHTTKPFLARDPYLLLKEKKVLDLPWITSTTANEGILPAGYYWKKLEEIENSWLDIAHYILDYNYTLPISKREEVAKKIKDFYLGPGEHINKQNFNKFVQIFTDRLFAIGGETAAKLQSRANKSPVYYYFFDYRETDNSLTRYFNEGEKLEGVSHGDDSFYFYGLMFGGHLSDKDKMLKRACLDMLYSYATTGKPSFGVGDTWLPTKDSELIYLNITGPEDIKLQTKEHLTPSEFWKTFGLSENGNVLVKDEL